MLNAVVAVDKGLPLRQAAEMYQMPKLTLHDQVAYGTRPGPEPYLTVEKEEELASFFKRKRSGTHTQNNRFLHWFDEKESLQL